MENISRNTIQASFFLGRLGRDIYCCRCNNGLLLEAIRINQTGMMWGDSIWSPVGYFIAALIGPLDGKENIVITIYRVLWMEHMLSTMLFLAFLPCTKFFHTLLAPFNALITPSRQGAILLPMNFENENAETFGLGKVSELTVKN